MEGQNSEIPLEKLGIENIDPKIINLSRKTFSKEEIEVLEMGFKFTPTPNPDNQTLEKDIDEFCRKLRLREFFGRVENFNDCIVQNKKGTTIQKGRNKHLDEYIDSLKTTKSSLKYRSHVKHNLNVKQKKALQNLKMKIQSFSRKPIKEEQLCVWTKLFTKPLFFNI